MKTDEFQLHTKQSLRANLVSRCCSATDQSLSTEASRKRAQRPLPNLWWSRPIPHQCCARRSTEMSLSVRLLKQRFIQNVLERWIAANAIFDPQESNSKSYPLFSEISGAPGLRFSSQPTWGSVERGYFESFEGDRCPAPMQKRWCKKAQRNRALEYRVNARGANSEDAK